MRSPIYARVSSRGYINKHAHVVVGVRVRHIHKDWFIAANIESAIITAEPLRTDVCASMTREAGYRCLRITSDTRAAQRVDNHVRVQVDIHVNQAPTHQDGPRDAEASEGVDGHGSFHKLNKILGDTSALHWLTLRALKQ